MLGAISHYTIKGRCDMVKVPAMMTRLYSGDDEFISTYRCSLSVLIVNFEEILYINGK